MKPFTSTLLAGLALAAFSTAASAETFVVQGDTAGSTTAGTIPNRLGKARTLAISSRSTAFLSFGVGDAGIDADSVTAARLTVYFPRVARSGVLTLSSLDAAFSETFSERIRPNPAVGSSFAVVNLAAPGREFVVVDITSQVKAWLTSPATDFGIAIASDGTASCRLATKEGAAAGHPATIEIDVNPSGGPVAGTTGDFSGTVSGTAGDFSGPVTGSTANFTNSLGIGTATTTKAKLQIEGSTDFTVDAVTYLWDQGLVGPPGGGVGSYPLSIYAERHISAGIFQSHSDERIKVVAGASDGADDLAKLMGIEITDYRYKDVVAKGSAPQKKVIAQQVEGVYPQAVFRNTDVVPDIYRKGTIADGWVTLEHDLEVGERVRLIGESAQGVHEVLEVRDGAFRTAFNPEGAAVFVYGREVDDFLSVDYEAISMLGVSATQELARKLAAKDAQIAALTTELEALRAADSERDERLARIERALGDRAVRAGETAPDLK